jgi:hypothetical protein
VYNKKKKPIMSLEKAIKKLTEVIQAATPAPGTGPALDSPRGSDLCKDTPPKGTLEYCKCYKNNKPTYVGSCYFLENGKCWILTYDDPFLGIPSRDLHKGANGECPIGIPIVKE